MFRNVHVFMVSGVQRGTKMDKGYVENGFIVDVSNAGKTSEIIYELSRILDLPDAQSKKVCIKLGSVDLSAVELTSVKALVESMNSEIEFVTTSSHVTAKSAEELNIKVSVLENKIPTPDFNADQDKVNKELEKALDRIFGDDNSEIKTFSEEKEIQELKKETVNAQETVSENRNTEFVSEADDKEAVKQVEPDAESEEVQSVSYDEFNKELETANETEAEAIKEIDADLDEIRKSLRETEKLPTLYIQRTLRSGQSISSDGNIVIIGDVNPGSEVIAKGDITVWGILAGIAHAGSDGNKFARIRALKMNAIQLRIADNFARRPDGINIPYIQKDDTFTPEEAVIKKKQIVIQRYKEV